MYKRQTPSPIRTSPRPLAAVASDAKFGVNPLYYSGTQSKCFLAHYRKLEFGSQAESFPLGYLSWQCLQPIWCTWLLNPVEKPAFIEQCTEIEQNLADRPSIELAGRA